MSVNKWIGIGNLGKDPEVKHLESGMVANFTLATTEKYKNKQGEQVSNTEWHNIVAWNKLAEIVEKYIRKGDRIYVEGKLKTRNYEKDGQKHYVTEIFADTIQMLGTKPEAQQAQSYSVPVQEPSPAQNVAAAIQTAADDLPF